MRTVVQRVKEASVTVDHQIVGKIQHGLLVLLAVHVEDEEKSIDWLANKLINLRVFSDADDKMNLNVQDVAGEILVVSQFTLYGDCSKGNRPGFIYSAKGEKAEAYYNKMVERLEELMPGRIQTGQFAAKMDVSLINDGPVTFIIDRMAN